jgi:hypothetical protein
VIPLLLLQALTLAWHPVDAPDLMGYRIYQAWGRPLTEESGYWEYITRATRDTTIVMDYIDTLPQNRPLINWFAVTAVDQAGNESGFSNQVSWPSGPPPSGPLPVPTGLRIVNTP